MDEEAKKLAQAFADSSERIYEKTYTIKGGSDDDVIVLVVVRTHKRGEGAIKKLSESNFIRKAVAGPAGVPCPLCGGTGKV